MARWKGAVDNDIRKMGIFNWTQIAQDRNGWRRVTREVLTLYGQRNHSRNRRRRRAKRKCKF
jgi:hypothetical protein